jgi:hypothetical protein
VVALPASAVEEDLVAAVLVLDARSRPAISLIAVSQSISS